MKRIHVITAALLVLGGLLTAAGQSRTEFRDFSQKGPDYKALENLRIATQDVVYSGEASINLFEHSYSASKYSLTTQLQVQTLCAIGAENIQAFEVVPANFEIFVAEDTDRSIHNTFVQTMYDIWSKKELYSGEYFFDFNTTKDNEYVLTAMPGLVNLKEFYYVWVNGRLIKIVFKGFQKGSGGWGVMDSFTGDLRIKIADREFKAYKYPLSIKKDFLKLYKAGLFNLPTTTLERKLTRPK